MNPSRTTTFVGLILACAGIPLSGQTAEELIASARAKESSGQYRSAIADLDRAIALRPDFAAAYLQRGADKIQLAGDSTRVRSEPIPLPPGWGPRVDEKAYYESALEDFARAITLQPNDAAAYLTRGDARLRPSYWPSSPDLTGAIADYDRAIALNPAFATLASVKSNHVAALTKRAALRYPNGDLSGTIADFDRAIVLDPTNDSLYGERALYKSDARDLPGALADADKAITLKPAPYHYRLRGNVRQETGDLAGAIADYQRYLENPFQKVPVERLHLYLDLLRLRRDPDSAELAPALAQWRAGWLKTVGLYLTEAGVSETDLLAAAEKYEEAPSTERCQANYFVGMKRLIAGNLAEARVFLERALVAGQRPAGQFSPPEFRFARAELARLPVSPSTPNP